MVKRSIYQIMLANTVIHNLFNQQINYPINIAYNILKLKKELDEIEELMLERWNILFGKNYNVEKFTEDEIILYNTTLETLVDIDIYGLTVNDLTNNSTVHLSLSDLENIILFLTT